MSKKYEVYKPALAFAGVAAIAVLALNQAQIKVVFGQESPTDAPASTPTVTGTIQVDQSPAAVPEKITPPSAKPTVLQPHRRKSAKAPEVIPTVIPIPYIFLDNSEACASGETSEPLPRPMRTDILMPAYPKPTPVHAGEC